MYDCIRYIESLGNIEDNTLVSALESFEFSDDELDYLSALESYANDIALEEELPEAKEELEDLKEAVKEKKGIKEKVNKLIRSIKSSLNVKDPEKRKKLIKRGSILLIIATTLISGLMYRKDMSDTIDELKIGRDYLKRFSEEMRKETDALEEKLREKKLLA